MNKLLKNYFSYGVVQGRLTISDELQKFPQSNWKNEFKIAKNLGFDFIELLVEREYNKNNPIWTDVGRKKILELIKNYNLKSTSICADYVINHSLLDNNNNEQAVNHVLDLCMLSSKIKCKKLILPLLEKSDLTDETSKFLIEPIKKILNVANFYDITICLETLMQGKQLCKFISYFDNKNLKVVFDTGNRALISKNLNDEIIILKEHIHHVHIKDKNENGENVLLGSGVVNFKEIFKTFFKIKYKGPIVFETTRGNDPILTAQHNINLCNFFYSDAKNEKINK